MRFIHSSSHPTIKMVAGLHATKERREKKLCIIEGLRSLTTALQGGMILQELFCTEELKNKARELAPDSSITCISPAAMNKISSAKTPSGLLGVFHIPSPPPAHTLTPGLVLAQVADPGNMGTLIRTAAACGIRSIVIVEGADPWSPKVIQASAGTCALVSIFQWSWLELIEAKKSLKLYALIVSGGSHPASIDTSHALLVVGNEARGIPEEWLTTCDFSISLPMPGNTESLNAAIAGSIALYISFVLR